MFVGPARMSTGKRNPDHQIDAHLRAGVDPENVHVAHAGGTPA